MSSSLRDQLLKAGLVDEKKLKAEKKSRHKTRKTEGRSQVPVPAESRVQADRIRREKAERDRKINLEKQQKRDRKAIHAQIREIVGNHRLDRTGAEIAYHFVHRGKVKKIYVDEEMRKQLVDGRLAVVRLDGRHELVPIAVAERIRERDETYVLAISDPDTEPAANAQDDPYADYAVPDDLVW
jgi:uncharacterized protein